MPRYIIQPAHAGTSQKEIDKAQRLYRDGEKRGKYSSAVHVIIKFSDVNGFVRCEYLHASTLAKLGGANIKNP